MTYSGKKEKTRKEEKGMFNFLLIFLSSNNHQTFFVWFYFSGHSSFFEHIT